MVVKDDPERGRAWGGGKGQAHKNVTDGTRENRQIVSVRDLYTLDHSESGEAVFVVGRDAFVAAEAYSFEAVVLYYLAGRDIP
jgi:hypothetical protein